MLPTLLLLLLAISVQRLLPFLLLLPAPFLLLLILLLLLLALLQERVVLYSPHNALSSAAPAAEQYGRQHTAQSKRQHVQLARRRCKHTVLLFCTLLYTTDAVCFLHTTFECWL
jgi:hypothetical protein